MKNLLPFYMNLRGEQETGQTRLVLYAKIHKSPTNVSSSCRVKELCSERLQEGSLPPARPPSRRPIISSVCDHEVCCVITQKPYCEWGLKTPGRLWVMDREGSLFPNPPSPSYTAPALQAGTGESRWAAPAGGEAVAGLRAFDAHPTLLVIHSWSFVLLYVARCEHHGGLSDHLKHAQGCVKPRRQQASHILSS